MPVSINGDYIPPETVEKKNNNSKEELFLKIKKLSYEAVASYLTKPKAKPYVEQLDFLRSDLPNEPLIKSIFDKLVGSVDAATGQIRDKQHWLYFVERNLHLLKWEFNRLNREPVTENHKNAL